MKSESKKLVILSRASYTIRDGTLYFQDNDGYYIDQICPLFDEVIICTRPTLANASDSKYGYKFQSQNIVLMDLMSPDLLPLSLNGIRELYKVIQHFQTADVNLGFINSVRGCALTLLSTLSGGAQLIVYNGTDLARSLRVRKVPFLKKKLTLTLEALCMQSASVRIVTGPYLKKKFDHLGNVNITAPASRLLGTKPKSRTPVLSKNPIKLLSTCHLRAPKHVDILIRACALLYRYDYPFVFDIIGSGQEVENLKELVRELGIEDSVHFHGYIAAPEKLKTFYEQADIWVLASEFEGFPRAIWEAIFFGAYVITTPVGGVELLFDESHMSIVPENTPEAFFDAIVKAFEKPDQTNQAIAHARTVLNHNLTGSIQDQFESFITQNRRASESLVAGRDAS